MAEPQVSVTSLSCNHLMAKFRFALGPHTVLGTKGIFADGYKKQTSKQKHSLQCGFEGLPPLQPSSIFLTFSTTPLQPFSYMEKKCFILNMLSLRLLLLIMQIHEDNSMSLSSYLLQGISVHNHHERIIVSLDFQVFFLL